MFNYRPLCAVFLSLLLGSLFTYWINVWKIFIIILIVVFVAVSLFVAIRYKKIKYFLIPIISFCVGVGCFHVAEKIFYHKTDIDKPEIIQSRVYSVNKEDANYMLVYLDSCYFDNQKQDTTMKLFIYDNENLYGNIDVGQVIRFSPKSFYATNIYHEESVESSSYSDKCKFVANVNIEDVSIVDEEYRLDETLRAKIKRNLHKGLTNQNGELVFSAMFGDKTLLSEDVYNNFKLSGVAHLLAVSGLHVGILAGIMIAILKLFKTRPLPKLIIVSIILLFYVYLCGFSVSVVRATIMTIVLLLAPVLFAEYDSLSSLSLAGIILFFINPFIAFDVGFILSFGCVLGIIMFTKPISRFMERFKLPKGIRNSLAISTATTISLIMPLAYYFNNLNVISILANIILIPIFTIAFTISFILSILSLILPFATNILIIINPLFEVVTILARFFGNLPLSNFTTINIPMISVVIYFALLMVISCMNMSNTRSKITVSLPIVAILIVSMVVF